jgi:hypothetical protein
LAVDIWEIHRVDKQTKHNLAALSPAQEYKITEKNPEYQN